MKLREKILVAASIVFGLMLALALILSEGILLKIAITVLALALTAYAIFHIAECVKDFRKTKICLSVIFAVIAAVVIAISILTWCNIIFVIA